MIWRLMEVIGEGTILLALGLLFFSSSVRLQDLEHERLIAGLNSGLTSTSDVFTDKEIADLMRQTTNRARQQSLLIEARNRKCEPEHADYVFSSENAYSCVKDQLERNRAILYSISRRVPDRLGEYMHISIQYWSGFLFLLGSALTMIGRIKSKIYTSKTG